MHEQDGKVIVTNSQDVQSLLDKNKAFRNDDLGKGKDMRHCASIPLHILHYLEQRGITKDPKRLKAWLNDPDNRAFRTSMDTV